jgi:hypothetical protein
VKLWGISIDDLGDIVRRVSVESYGGNIRVGEGCQGTWSESGKRVRVVTFGLRCESSKGPGHRVSASAFGPRRRMVAACWHAHRDVLAAIFDANPDARLKSILADYRGRADFLASFPATGAKNIGAPIAPVRADKACECDGEYVPPMVDPPRAFGPDRSPVAFLSPDADTWSPDKADAEASAMLDFLAECRATDEARRERRRIAR